MPERIDDLQRDGLRIIQDPEGFCFGTDAVLLADFVRIPPGGRALDMCTGTGIIPILLSARTKASYIAGLELQKRAADMAARSVGLNGLTGRLEIYEGDVKEASRIFAGQHFDVITANPPYMKCHNGLVNPDDVKALSRHELTMDFDDLARESSALLTEGGKLFIVHRPQRLPEIITTLKSYDLEPKRLRMVHTYIHREANLFLMEARKGGGRELRTLPPLIVYSEKGVYSEEMDSIYAN